MGFSLRIPLGRGTLKIKSRGRIRPGEIKRKLPKTSMLGIYFLWDNAAKPDGDREAPPF